MIIINNGPIRSKNTDPDFFIKLSKQQAPEYLWIGCSDSRVPANEIVDLLPGELFVHRNVANIVLQTDLNCQSVIQYAVDVLHVKHIIVCGHYGCGGIKAAMSGEKFGLIDQWISHIKDIYQQHLAEIEEQVSENDRQNKLCELNVINQVANVCNSPVVRDAWQRKHDLTVHGWIYSIEDGALKDLDVSVDNAEQGKP